VETNNKQRVRSGDRQRASAKNTEKHDVVAVNEVAPGVPIVRSSTPKPLSLGPGETPLVPGFPSKAPSAPPLPEEIDDIESEHTTSGAIPAMPAIPLTSRPRPSLEESQEFVWLFEYGLEMDPVLLNSPDRLNGVAMLYGPALLKGYTLVFGRAPAQDENAGQLLTAIVPSSDPQAEVWGVLYRIPRRVTERASNQSSLLDVAHTTTLPANLFESAQVVVRERYRDREISVTAYVATDQFRQHLTRASTEPGSEDALLIQRVAATARKQRLPDSYVDTYMLPVAPTSVSLEPPGEEPAEKDTESLPTWHQQSGNLPMLPQMVRVAVPATAINPWLTAFAIYLMFVLLGVLTFAVLQASGFGNTVLVKTFAPLGVPWLVLVYGLLGGCMSCLIFLGRMRMYNPPVFIVVIWFTRPYIGLVLAMLVYLLLNSGLFTLASNPEQRMVWFLLSGVLAGMCEGWLFVRRR
jgi:cation transport regulator ChaC